jgi:hypothetical protein
MIGLSVLYVICVLLVFMEFGLLALPSIMLATFVIMCFIFWKIGVFILCVSGGCYVGYWIFDKIATHYKGNKQI